MPPSQQFASSSSPKTEHAAPSSLLLQPSHSAPSLQSTSIHWSSEAARAVADTCSKFDFGHEKFSPPELDYFRRKVEAAAPEWSEKLHRAGFEGVEICTSGAFATGHFRGPKPREHSLNPNVPDQFNRVVEGDMRIIFPSNVDPHDPEIIRLVSDVTGTKYEKSKVIQRWNAEIPISYMYGYEAIQGDLGFEWEVCINRRPYVEIADKWKDIFTPNEIEWQADLRDQLRDWRVDYATDYSTLKDLQVSECRYRIIAGLALHEYHKTASPAEKQLFEDFPEFDMTSEQLKFLSNTVDLWLSGDGGLAGLDKPTSIASNQIVQRLGEEAPHLLERPETPQWVRFATALQSRIRNGR